MSTGRRTPGISTVNLSPCIPLFRAIWIAPYEAAARLNSSVLPSASSDTRANIQPRKRSRVVSSLICFCPLATAHSSSDVLTLFARSGRNGLPVGIFNSQPPLGNLGQRAASPMCPCRTNQQPTGTGLSNFAPAVEVHGLAVAHVLGALRTYHVWGEPRPSAATRVGR